MEMMPSHLSQKRGKMLEIYGVPVFTVLSFASDPFKSSAERQGILFHSRIDHSADPICASIYEPQKRPTISQLDCNSITVRSTWELRQYEKRRIEIWKANKWLRDEKNRGKTPQKTRNLKGEWILVAQVANTSTQMEIKIMIQCKWDLFESFVRGDFC